MTGTFAERVQYFLEHIAEYADNTVEGVSYRTLLTEAVTIIADLQRWKDELTDCAVVDWSLSNVNQDNPRQMIADIIQNNMNQALDPAISAEAVALIEQGRLEVRRKLDETIDAFNADDSVAAAGQLVEMLEPLMLTRAEGAIHDCAKCGEPCRCKHHPCSGCFAHEEDPVNPDTGLPKWKLDELE